MPILDQFGQPITSKPPVARAGGAVSVRLNQFNYPISGLTPQKLVAVLREADEGYLEHQAELIAEMEERDGHLLSQLQIRRLALSGLEWRVVPADSSPQAQRIAEAFSDWWVNNDQNELILNTADAIGQGVSITQMTWARSSGHWYPSQFEHVSASNLVYDRVDKRFKGFDRR
ncbi:MAG: DUF935 family protein, partial [Pleurocapsa sp. SU_196_0]|nr:DUF935 family protein [Pleurocapsa sp. SU_196_0]